VVVRLFLAAELPEAIRIGLAGAQRDLKTNCPGWRWVRPEGIHLTLRFLGEVPPGEDALQREGWRRAASSCRPTSIRIGGAGVFPSVRRPRVLWVGVTEIGPGGRLEALSDAMECAARKAGFRPETRRFRPHLTLARVARGGRPSAPDHESVGEIGVVEISEVVLFRSELRPEGARYTALDRFPLGIRSGRR
jgi:2'-5' RNA ligase